jgi:hypothetical protein
MSRRELDNLVAIGSLKHEVPSTIEIASLMHSARARLQDARSEQLALESRFDLAYNAAHAFALAAMRFHGYRSTNRYLVFQVLPYTASVDTATWRVLAKAHGERNLLEYEGGGEVDARLLADLIAAVTKIEEMVTTLVR